VAKRLDMKDVNIYYGAFHAVADVSLSILPRSVTAFIGASGCGKTTVLRTLNRMHEVIPGARVDGTVLLDDENIYGPGIDPVGVRRAIGMVFQRPNPFPAMSIRDNVVAGLKLQGVRNRKLLDETAEYSLRGANLWDEVKDRLNKPGGGLSGGQQQRLCIARAIAVQPDVLLMDEPCSALDPISTMAIEELISELKQDYTIVIVTTCSRPRGSAITPGSSIWKQQESPAGSSRSMTPARSFPTRPRRPPRTTYRAASAKKLRRRGRRVFVRQLAGCLEDDTPRHFNRVVGEALVEPSQQRDVDGGSHAVLPFSVHQHRE
jgi:phosphate transport system ATP-binding protein